MKREILVVEDNEINRAILCEILSGEYHVLEAQNGQEALQILHDHKNPISLILLDMQMPVMDGYTFLNHVKQDEALSLIPVIVMTQGNSEEDELSALEHGATDFLPKPYRPQIILHRVAGLIKLRETSSMVNQLRYDTLTGLYTKEYFAQQVRQRLMEDPDGQYTIVCSNIEHFKLVNDIFGVQAGNRLLKEVADLTKQMVGDTGFCGRFGADRFLFLQTREKEQHDRNAFGSDFGIKLSPLLKSVVIRWGIYEITDRDLPVEQMCDRALLAADSIRNQYRKLFAVYDDSLRSKLLREQAITSSVETALKEEQFVVYYQPKYNLHENCLAGAEALVRWIHPEWGFLSPGEFIPLFEKNGFIPRLDQYVREKVCAQLHDWQQKGYPIVPVSVNISRADVFHGDLPGSIQSLTQSYDISPVNLHLEITESAYAGAPDQIISTVDTLRKMGFVVEMDDFGSGYSSLNMLSQMPLDILKLDKDFIQNEIAKPANRSLLSNVISMAHQIDMTVVAEGVETREQVNRLRAMGCDFVQGYFFAKPMPGNEFEKLLQVSALQDSSDAGKSRRLEVEPNTLLVVDTDAVYRALVHEAFSSQYQILEADSAEQAIDIMSASSEGSLCAVILSMALPEGGSATVFHRLRQTPALWDVPVLATIPSSDCTMKLPLALEADDFLCKSHPLFDLYRRVQRLVDNAALRRREYLLQDEASHDALTGLLNRRGYRDAVSIIKDTDLPIALCIFDLDNLKQINDSMGHEKGDCLLRTFADVLSGQTRSEDIKCRYGGDEFILVLKHMSSVENATAKVESICRMFHQYATEQGFHASCSVGISWCGRDSAPSSDLITYADQALYRAKRENKGGYCVWVAENG